MNLEDIFNLIYSKYVSFGTYEELVSAMNDVNLSSGEQHDNLV